MPKRKQSEKSRSSKIMTVQDLPRTLVRENTIKGLMRGK